MLSESYVVTTERQRGGGQKQHIEKRFGMTKSASARQARKSGAPGEGLDAHQCGTSDTSFTLMRARGYALRRS